MMFGSMAYWFLTIAAVIAACGLTMYAAWKRPNKGAYLCEDCRFNDAESCHKPERPYAIECTSYRTKAE